MAQKSPLDAYRSQEKFSKEDIQNSFEDEECLKFQNEMWQTLEKDPLFRPTEKEITGQLSMEEYRHITHLRAKKYAGYKFYTFDKIMEHPLIPSYTDIQSGNMAWEIGGRTALNSNVSTNLQ